MPKNSMKRELYVIPTDIQKEIKTRITNVITKYNGVPKGFKFFTDSHKFLDLFLRRIDIILDEPLQGNLNTIRRSFRIELIKLNSSLEHSNYTVHLELGSNHKCLTFYVVNIKPVSESAKEKLIEKRMAPPLIKNGKKKK